MIFLRDAFKGHNPFDVLFLFYFCICSTVVMTSIQRVVKTVECIPDLHDVDGSLLDHFRRRYENTCTKECGYILGVLNVHKVLRRRLSAYNGNLIAECEINVRCLRPHIGQRVQGLVRQVFAQGMIVWVHECMKVFLPHSGTPLPARVDDLVSLEITQTRFQKGRYDCIGKWMES